MNDTRYKWIFYVISIVILSTIGIQVYWNYKNYQTNKQQLINDVQVSLDNAVDSYYANLAEHSAIGGFTLQSSPKDSLFDAAFEIDSLLDPNPRNYGFKLNKNVKRLARKSAFTIKASEKAITVLEDFTFDSPKTKNFTAVLKALNLETKKSLFVLGGSNNNVYLSSRNLKGSEVLIDSEISTYKILNANQVVLFESALKNIETNLSK